MSTPAVFLRRARIRGLKEGLIQTARVEALENDVKDNAERMQDYGHAANLPDGQGVVLTIGGHTIILRMDLIASRPQLAPYEVSLWHKEGHNVTLRGGKVVEANCDIYKINAAVKIELNTPTVAMSAKATVGSTLGVTGKATVGSLSSAGKNIDGHNHNENGAVTGPNN